jgi:hypothetical protein
MCMQCMAGAMTAGAAATGSRVWLAAYAPRWLTPRRLRAITVTLLGAALLLSASLLSGSA